MRRLASLSGQSRAASGKLATVVTFLQMDAPPAQPAPKPTLQGVGLASLGEPRVQGYRWLLDSVGRNWHWVDVLRLPDDVVERRLADSNREIRVLKLGQRSSGFFEVLHEMPELAEISYFGLMPHAIGRGLGRWFLHAALSSAWARRPSRVVVKTCTLDHPAALPLYLSAGFRRIGHQLDTVVPLSESERAAILEP